MHVYVNRRTAMCAGIQLHALYVYMYMCMCVSGICTYTYVYIPT